MMDVDWLTMQTTLSGVSIVIALSVVYFLVTPMCRHLQRIWQLRAIPYGEPPHWFWGHTQKTLKRDSASERWQRWLKVNSRMVKAVFLSIPRISLCHPETACAVLRTGACKRRSALVYNVLTPWIGDVNGLLSGARHRRLLGRLFAQDDYVNIYHGTTQVMLDRWSETIVSGRTAVNATTSCANVVMDILLQCALSYASDCQSERPGKKGVLAHKLLTIFQCLEERLLSPYQRNAIIFRWSSNGRKFFRCKHYCRDLMHKIIQERRNSANYKKTRQDCSHHSQNDFLDSLLLVNHEHSQERDSALDNEGICNVLSAVLFQAHDATASALRWTLYYLAKYPDLQERCREEVQMAVSGRETAVCRAELDKFLYLSRFVNETIRLTATVPFVALTLSERVVIDGHILPIGTWISIPVLAIHQNPAVWEKPLDFNPDRFLPENAAKRHPFAFMPFLTGPCNCIGQRMAMDIIKTVLALVLLNYQLAVDTSVPPPRYLGSFTSKTTEDIQLVVHKIS